VALVAACQVEPNQIHFIVADGYRGPIAVVASPDFPEPEGYRSRPEQFVLIVPDTGVVCVPTYTIFHAFLHSAEYADGSTIYHHDSLASEPGAMRLDGFGAWGGETKHHGVVWFGVGTEPDVDALEGAFFSNAIQTMMPTAVSLRSRNEIERYARYCR
jgi:hypothetical protein